MRHRIPATVDHRKSGGFMLVIEKEDKGIFQDQTLNNGRKNPNQLRFARKDGTGLRGFLFFDSSRFWILKNIPARNQKAGHKIAKQVPPPDSCCRTCPGTEHNAHRIKALAPEWTSPISGTELSSDVRTGQSRN